MSFLSPTTKNDCTDVNPHKRVVLLLDMDCFYAQCETVRLGLDQSMPLALVQVSLEHTCLISATNMITSHAPSESFFFCSGDLLWL